MCNLVNGEIERFTHILEYFLPPALLSLFSNDFPFLELLAWVKTLCSEESSEHVGQIAYLSSEIAEARTLAQLSMGWAHFERDVK